MSKAFTFVIDQTAQAALGSKRKLRRRRGACGNCKRRKVACNGSIPCQHCLKASMHCQYSESNRSIDNTVLNNEPDSTTQLTRIASEVGVLSNSQDFEHTDFYPDDFTNISTPELYHDDLAHASVPDDPMDLFDWNQLGDVFNGSIPELSPNSELLGSTRQHEYAHIRSLNTDQSSYYDMRYCRSASDISRSYIVSTSVGTDSIVDEPPYSDHVRSSLYSWLLTSIRRLRRDESSRIVQALQQLLVANSLITEYCSSTELDMMTVLNDLRSERSFNKEFFYKRIKACFVELHGIGVFLDSATMEPLVDQILSHPFVSSPTSIALFFSLLAIGSRRLDLGHGTGTIQGSTIGFFRIALRMRPHPYEESHLLTLQALLPMTYFSSAIGADSTSSLMVDATSGLQTLRLHSCSAISKLSSDRMEQASIKRAFWAIYSMEKPYCLQEGLLPLIHGGYADHTISTSQRSALKGNDWLNVNIRYAEVCSGILQQLHSQRHDSRSCSCCCGRANCEHNSASTVSGLEAKLIMWKNDISFDFKVDNLSALACDERRRRINYISKYHFAMIAIYSLPEIEMTEISKEKRYESAREILNMSTHVSWPDLCDNWSLCSVISLATCIIAAGTIQKASLAEAQKGNATTDRMEANKYSYESGVETDIPYLGIAIGFFSRISLSTTQEFGAAAMELCSFALRLAKC